MLIYLRTGNSASQMFRRAGPPLLHHHYVAASARSFCIAKHRLIRGVRLRVSGMNGADGGRRRRQRSGSGYAYRGVKAWLLLSDDADSVAPAITSAIPVMFALHSWRIWDICPLDAPSFPRKSYCRRLSPYTTLTPTLNHNGNTNSRSLIAQP